LVTLLIGAGIPILVFWFLRSLRWYLLLRSINITITLRQIYLVTALSLSVALLTPLMSGEILKIEMLKSKGLMSRVHGYSTLALEKILDVIIVVSMGLLGVPMFFAKEFSYATALICFTVFIALAVAALLMVSHLKLSGSMGKLVSDIRKLLSNTKNFYMALGLTAAGWAAIAFGWMACLVSISIDISFPKTAAVMGIVTLANIISLVPGGIGISETTAAELLIQMGYATAKAQAGAIMFRVFELYMLIWGGLHYMVWRYVTGGEKISQLQPPE
jgi:uncharacterized membrane protein YbhN (UPF0104 family)